MKTILGLNHIGLFSGSVLLAGLLFGCSTGATAESQSPLREPPAEIRVTGQSVVGGKAAQVGDAQTEPLPAPNEYRARPGVVARVQVTDEPNWIIDLRHDARTGRLFATTNDGKLVVLDGSAYTVERQFPFGGELILDEEGRRLYVMPGDQYVPEEETIAVSVVDVDSFDIIGQIEGVHFVSLDPQNGRLFGGSPVRAYEDGRAADTVHVYDLRTLEHLYDVAQQGIPTYNPYRDELFVTAYTVLIVDPDTGQTKLDLMPELEDQPFAWCNGCEYARRVYIVEPEAIAVVEKEKVSTGGGPGFSPDPRYMDARTLQEEKESVHRLSVQPVCSTQRIVIPPIEDRLYHQPHYVRYVVFRNFNVHNTGGELENWWDGLSARYINPRTQQAYSSQGYVLDLKTMTPVGRLPDFCALDDDPASGRVFGRIDGDLIILNEDGGFPVTAPPTEVEPLPDSPITGILVSPQYPADPTLFVLLEDNRLYRSSDNGNTWLRVQGGLPDYDNVKLDVALSPDFATDRTMFAGGFVGDYQGEGVLKSEDAGDTWRPMWSGLTHLRVFDVQIAPTFTQDGSVRALSWYTRLDPWETGVSLHESTDRGLTWTLEYTTTDGFEMQKHLTAQGLADESLPVRVVGYGEALEVMDEYGIWTTADLRQQDGELIRAVVPSPRHQEDATYYVLGDYSLWRTIDGAKTWWRWQDPRLEGRDYTNALSALAATPALPDGSHNLFVGTYAGEFWILEPESAAPTLGAQPEAQDNVAEQVRTQEATPAPTFAMTTPPEGFYVPDGALASTWEASPDVQAALGWALTELATSIPSAYQAFEHGAMIWNGSNGTILVLYEDGTWEAHPDSFEEGQPELDPAIVPPSDKFQPVRGFGALWRSSASIRDRLGWATQEEYGYTPYTHEFERGFLLGSPIGALVLTRSSETGGQWR